MGYLHIQNLYKDTTVLLFKEVYALEKIHGTSAHIRFNPADGSIRYFSGGTAHATFVALFNETELLEKLKACAFPADKTVTIYGESYGGKEQGMSNTYGKVPKFIVFDVRIGDCWLDVPNAESICLALGLEFVSYVRTFTDLASLDALRDAPSEQAKRNGIVDFKHREGIILRPLKEMTLNNGNRVIAKHKGAAFAETATPRTVELDPTKLAQLAEADAVANEWVTHNRIHNALSHFKEEERSIENMGSLLKYIVADVEREGSGEVVMTPAVRKAVSSKASKLFKDYFCSLLKRV